LARRKNVSFFGAITRGVGFSKSAKLGPEGNHLKFGSREAEIVRHCSRLIDAVKNNTGYEIARLRDENGKQHRRLCELEMKVNRLERRMRDVLGPEPPAPAVNLR